MALVEKFYQQLGILINKSNLDNERNIYGATKHCTKCYIYNVIFASAQHKSQYPLGVYS